MKAVRLIGPRQSRVVEIAEPRIGRNEVLIKVKACGVCASELHTWQQGPKEPCILGHEPIGVIEETGDDVVGFAKGDRVTGLFGSAFAEYAKAHYKNLVKVPEALDDLEAIGEPLSCLVSGANRTPVTLGDSAAVVGVGFMGLGFLQLLRLKGVGRLIAVDVREESLHHARRFGADEVYFPHEIPKDYKVTKWADIGKGLDITVEAGGAPGTLELASEMVKAHGVMSVVGYHQSNGGVRNIQMNLWNWKAITVINAHERRNEVHLNAMKAIHRLIETRRFDMRGMITHIYSLSEVDQAFRDLVNKPGGFIKAVIRID
ncbi:MAG: alcohol dehydrogenase catalytic domain-containing protein [Alicyclobacillus sp.]|nr:alcohol dehydrogenase catalytic domain-containing protein [Alicyclobacillus sp.]